MSDVCFLRAVDQAGMLRRREISAAELVDLHIEQIERVDPGLNAIVTFVPEVAREMAAAADAAISRATQG